MIHTNINADTTLDITGSRCPIPSLRTVKALLGIETGQVIHVMTTDPNTKLSIPILVKQSGNELLDLLDDDQGVHHFFVKKA